uniref:TGF-beta-activated kinase 1 and MAP3K7-binding protein 1 isoform X2 n=1 Tax=Myxine glutinosa TaxID=7769 RepID=UPI00358FA52A
MSVVSSTATAVHAGKMATPRGGKAACVQQAPERNWTDDLPVCQLSGVGMVANALYEPDGSCPEERPCEDCALRFRSEERYLYGVFNGFGGNRVSNFVSQRLPAELLLGQLAPGDKDSKVKTALLQAFDVVERSFFESIDDALAEKADLQSRLPEGSVQYTFGTQYPQLVERLQALEREVGGGTTAVVALVLNNRLFVANVGTNRALLCRMTSGDGLDIVQLNSDHHMQNEAELQRLVQLGLDIEKVKEEGALGQIDCTRRIGDYKIKLGYKDIAALNGAKSEPVIAVPEVSGGTSLEGTIGFLLLASDGLWSALETIHGPGTANRELAILVAREFLLRSSVTAVAQVVVERVVQLHQETRLERAKNDGETHAIEQHDDATLLIRNLGFPPGGQALTNSNSTGAHTYPVSVPYSTGQGHPGKTSVMLSLVMPYSGPIVNGSHSTGSTSDDVTPSNPVLSGPSPHTTLQSHTHSSSSSSGEGHLFRGPRQSSHVPPDEDGHVEPYVDFSEFYQLWNLEHGNPAGELT